MSSNGQHFFVLKAANGEPLVQSETYQTAGGRNRGVEAVQRAAPAATVADLTQGEGKK